MTIRGLVAFPYQVARTPLTVLGETVVRHLPPTSFARQSFDRGFGMMDLIAGKLLGDDTLTRQGAERLYPPRGAAPEPAATSEPAVTPETTAPEKPTAARPKPSPAKRARATATKRQQHDNARPNKNLATIRLQMEQTEAVAEARDHQDEQE